MKINWKGSIISLGICGIVLGGSYYLNYINTHTAYDTSKITAAQPDIVTEDVNGKIHPTDSTNDSPFVNDDYMKTPVENSDGSAAVDKSPEPEIGMTEDEVINSSWGNTSDKSTTKSSYGTSALWMYDNGRSIFFIDGKVNSITE